MKNEARSVFIKIMGIAWLLLSIPVVTTLLKTMDYHQLSWAGCFGNAVVFTSPGLIAAIVWLLPVTFLIPGWKNSVTTIYLFMEIFFYGLIILVSIGLFLWFSLRSKPAIPGMFLYPSLFGVLIVCFIIGFMTIVPSVMTLHRMRAIRRSAQQVDIPGRNKSGD